MRVGIVGYGEVGGIFARELRGAGVAVVVGDCDGGALGRARAEGVGVASSNAAAAEGADVVFVCVTAGSVGEAVGQMLPGLGHGPLVVDVNSVAPATKQRAAGAVEGAGGRYVEAAVMTSVPPRGLRSPMLLGGPHAGAFMAWGRAYGMTLTAFSGEVGPASAVKMCRSVLIKGLEALLTESMLAAAHYGVVDDVLATLDDTFPGTDWPTLARYMIGRSLQHGGRRAEEMAEVAVTVADAGVAPTASKAIVMRQAWAGGRGRALGAEVCAAGDLAALLSAIGGA